MSRDNPNHHALNQIKTITTPLKVFRGNGVQIVVPTAQLTPRSAADVVSSKRELAPMTTSRVEYLTLLRLTAVPSR